MLFLFSFQGANMLPHRGNYSSITNQNSFVNTFLFLFRRLLNSDFYNITWIINLCQHIFVFFIITDLT